MSSLLGRTLLAVLAPLLVLVAFQLSTTSLALHRSLGEWDRVRAGELRALATQILQNGPAAVSVPGDMALVVFDPEGNLVYSNRGEDARTRPGGNPRAVIVDGRLLGSYVAREARFGSDAANGRFLASLTQGLWAGLGLSVAVAATLALVLSRSLANPAIRLARDLDRIASGDLSWPVRESGAREIALIGASANRLRERLQREQELRRQWVQDIAHDLRTPVAALRAQFEGMRDGVLDVSAERMEIALREIARAQALVTDLEELMRLESPEMRIAATRVDARSLVEEIGRRFEHALQAKGIRLRTDVTPTSIWADAALIHRALGNLLDNAVRHCPEGGIIAVAVREQAGAVTLSVSNTGQPIPAQDLPRVFDRLFRGEPARGSAGSGLGLTIVQRIARLHGGDATVTNRPDGVVVDMRLPQPPAAQP